MAKYPWKEGKTSHDWLRTGYELVTTLVTMNKKRRETGGHLGNATPA